MPRDGTETYILPFPDVVADTTIESPVYNGFTNDVAQDLNNPRPITSGGTGATSAAGALAALGGETAAQVITNYDSYIFKAGSFYSAAGATAAPTANAFSGICYLSDANNIVIEARDTTTGIKHVRRKVAGVWGAFAIDASASFVELAGDTMTGALVLAGDATIPLHPATKQQLDALDAELAAAIAAEVTRANAAYQAKDPQLFAVMPMKSNGDTSYGTILTDAEKCIYGAAGSVTIDASLAYLAGTRITFLAFGGTLNIGISGNILYWNQGGVAQTGARIISNTGIATAIKTVGGPWVISGHGIT